MTEQIYHGSGQKIIDPKIITRTDRVRDFGNGFYCTENREQAVRWAERFRRPHINKYSVEIPDDFRICSFAEPDEAWLNQLTYGRMGGTHEYDIIIGPFIDDKICFDFNLYLKGLETRQVFLEACRNRRPAQQIVFCTDRAVSCLKFIKCEEML